MLAGPNGQLALMAAQQAQFDAARRQGLSMQGLGGAAQQEAFFGLGTQAPTQPRSKDLSLREELQADTDKWLGDVNNG